MKDERPESSEDRIRKARDESRKDRGDGPVADTRLDLSDFYAYMPAHRYIFAPTRETLALVQRQRANTAGRGRRRDPIPASVWLDHHQPVEQLTWYPGEPMLIRRPADRRRRLHRAARDRPSSTYTGRRTACPAIPARPLRGSTMSARSIRTTPTISSAGWRTACSSPPRRSTTRCCSAAHLASARTRCCTR